jgi:uncharacterized peroxidase-related enzyme
VSRTGRRKSGPGEDVPRSWLPVPNLQDLPDDMRAICEEELGSRGFVPFVIRYLALRPGFFRAWDQAMAEVMEGRSELSPAQREMIAVVVSAVNGCHYCSASHGAALLELTGDRALVATLRANVELADVDESERAMLRFALKLTRHANAATREDLLTLRAAGLSDETIFDVVATTGLFNMTNRVASALGWRPNAEYLDGLG